MNLKEQYRKEQNKDVYAGRTGEKYPIYSTEYVEWLEKKCTIADVMFELPDYMEVRKRIKHVVENSFEDYETVEKREYTLGFNACYNWLKIKFMQRKGN